MNELDAAWRRAMECDDLRDERRAKKREEGLMSDIYQKVEQTIAETLLRTRADHPDSWAMVNTINAENPDLMRRLAEALVRAEVERMVKEELAAGPEVVEEKA